MSKDATYTGTRSIRTFADLMRGAVGMIDIAEKNQEASYFTIMSGLLLTTFTFEAYLNHLGEALSCWKKGDRLRVGDKLDMICGHLGIKPDKSCRPYQTSIELFEFRNSIAHGRSEVMKLEKPVDSKDDPSSHAPKTKAEEYCELGKAKKAIKDIRIIVEELNRAAGFEKYPFSSGATIGLVSKK